MKRQSRRRTFELRPIPLTKHQHYVMKLTDDRHCLLINRGQGCHNASLFHPPLAVSCHTIGRRLHYSKSAGAVETIGINSEEAPNAVSVRISSVQVCNDG